MTNHKIAAHAICDSKLEEYISFIDSFFDKSLSDKKTEEIFKKITGLVDKDLVKKPLVSNLLYYNLKDENELKDINRKIKDMLFYIQNKIDTVLIGTPQDIMGIYEHIQKEFNFRINGKKDNPLIFQINEIKQDGFVFCILEKIFDYDIYSDKYAYNLTKNLRINICPYCNREYIFTVMIEEEKTNEDDTNVNITKDNRARLLSSEGRKRIVRPDIDHYFGQKRFPIFRLSFQNLIPSGVICNRSIKGQRELDINHFLHPYIHEKNENFHFSIKMNSDLKMECKINVNEDSKAYKTARFFKLDEIYSYHSYVAEKANELMQAYPMIYIEYLEKCLNEELERNHDNESKYLSIKTSKRKIFDIIFSEYIIKNPDGEILGNLKNDIYLFINNFYFNDRNK